MQIQLSEHFTYKKLLQFVMPSIVMMIFTSIYSVVDGLFVSNFVGKTAFAAVNLMMPFLMGVSALGFMIGTGGSAIVAKTLGEGKKELANEYFSMLVYVTIIGGLMITITGMLVVRPVAIALGASGELLENSILYGRILFISLTPFMLQNVFQSFFVAAEKPHLGLRVIIIAGVTNMILDFLFVAVLHFGLAGAAFATVCGEFIGGLFPVFYFARKNSSLLRLGRTHFYKKVLLQTCKFTLQYSADEICRRKRSCCLWNNYVCQFYFRCHLFWILHRQCAYRQLPLWCCKPYRAEKSASEKHYPSEYMGIVTGHSCSINCNTTCNALRGL